MDNGSEDDDERMEEDPKPANLKKTSKGKPTTQKRPKVPKEKAKESEREKKVIAAQFSINVIDLFNPPLEIHFGKWNSRPVSTTEWMKLKAAMTLQDIKPFTPENMMPLVISPRHVDTSCVENNLNGYKAKTLMLSEEGKREMKKLLMAGGRHRMAAIQSIKEDKDNELAMMTAELDKLKGKNVTQPKAVAKKLANVEEKEKKIAALKEEISKLGIWGVILYDQGMLNCVLMRTVTNLRM